MFISTSVDARPQHPVDKQIDEIMKAITLIKLFFLVLEKST